MKRNEYVNKSNKLIIPHRIRTMASNEIQVRYYKNDKAS